mmetsp:Transcript_38809/g.79381  ORF Transcript_38809/g.79381 Transcript_38809/m.79381 type:complete len:86 (-) Transcript_38809:626-883(-)
MSSYGLMSMIPCEILRSRWATGVLRSHWQSFGLGCLTKDQPNHVPLRLLSLAGQQEFRGKIRGMIAKRRAVKCASKKSAAIRTMS